MVSSKQLFRAFLNTVFGDNWGEILMYFVLMGFVLYIITDKFSYFVNVIIYWISKLLITVLFLPKITFEIVIINIVADLISSIIIVYIAQKYREYFDYDSSIWYIFLLVYIVQFLTVAFITKTVSFIIN